MAGSTLRIHATRRSPVAMVSDPLGGGDELAQGSPDLGDAAVEAMATKADKILDVRFGEEFGEPRGRLHPRNWQGARPMLLDLGGYCCRKRLKACH